MLPHIVAVAMLAFAVLLLLTCTLLLCKIVVWSRRRRGVPADTQLSVASLRVVESALIESIASQTYGVSPTTGTYWAMHVSGGWGGMWTD